MSNPKGSGGIGLEESHPDERRKHFQKVEKVAKCIKDARETMGLEHEGKIDLLLDTPAAFDVQPSEIIFKDVEPGQIYQMTVMVKNLTKNVKRIRVFQPKNSCFRCDYAMLGPIAPGLAIELVVSFESEEKGEFYDSITIVSDNIEFEVKISAYSPMAKIIFEPFINFGFIQAGKTKSETILFKNEGSVPGRVRIVTEEIKDLKVDQKGLFLLNQGEIVPVTFSYSPREPGIFRGEVRVEVLDGKSFTDKIDVNATCVEFLRFIINEEGEELYKVDFGNVLFGQKKHMTGHLVNNSPEGFYYRIAYLTGLHTVYKEENNIFTPHEQGVQQTRRLLFVEPAEGYIKSYDQVPLTFGCRTWVEEDHQIWTRNYAMTTHKEDMDIKDLHKNIQCTAVFFFKKTQNLDDSEENRVLMMHAEAVCPRVNFSQLNADFGKVAVGEEGVIMLTVENDSKNSDIRLECPKTSIFTCTPHDLILKPREKQEIKLLFLPKNFGKVGVELEFVINKKYKIPFKFAGLGKPLVDKSKEIESSQQAREKDSEDQQNLASSNFDRNNTTRLPLLKRKEGLQASKSEAHLTTRLAPFHSHVDSSKASQKSKTELPNFPKESRLKRLNEQKQKHLQLQMSQLELKTKELLPRYTTMMRGSAKLSTIQGDKNNEKEQPVEDFILNDLKFLFNENWDGLEPPKMEIPKKVDKLFVSKPLGKYEPADRGDVGEFKPDPNQQLRKLPEHATTHTMTREINMTLTSEMLKHVMAGPTNIDFGRVFVWSRTKKYFHIRNEMKSAIRARMILDNEEELEESDHAAQVISTGQTATFQLVFLAKRTMEVNKILKYVINEKHFFKYIIRAVVVPVDLDVSDQKVELSFGDENLEMTTYKTITLRNNGNDIANFEWHSQMPSTFKLDPMRGSVEPGGTKKVKVIYYPSESRPLEESEIALKIQHGLSKQVQVIGQVLETKCDISPSILNFGSIAVGDSPKLHFNLKNSNTRTSAIFQVDAATLGPNIKVNPMAGRVLPDSAVKFEVEFSSVQQVSNLTKTFMIIVRGSKPVTVPYTVSVIIPKVVIHEKMFDFKTITYGNSAVLPMHIENTSPIVAKLELDLRVRPEDPESEQFACLKVVQDKNSADDSLIMEEKDIDMEEERKRKQKAIEDEKNDILNHQKDLDEIMPSDDSEQGDMREQSYASDIPDNNDCFILTLKPNKSYKFLLTFTPQLTKTYSFNLPLTLSGFKEYTDLLRPILCKAVHPRIVLDPIDGVRDFKKKTITQVEGGVPDTMTLKVSNPDPTAAVRFFIDTNEIDDNKMFHLSKTEGVVPPKSTIEIVCEFRPNAQGSYNIQLPMFVDDERVTPKAIITLKGEAAFPRILFDRREIIMPIVPLGVESKITFYIYNDGYQTVNLKGYIIETFQHFPIKVEFPEGPSLNTKRDRLKCEMSFTSKQPLSFTTQLFVEDDQKTMYTIFVSGTTDNSIMTNYSYFQRTPREDYELVENNDRPLAIKFPDKSEQSIRSERASVTHSRLSGGTSAANRVGLGYTPIPFDMLDRACKHMARFLNVFVPGLKIENFPQDLITKNGEQLIKVVEFFSKTNLNIRSKFNSDMKKADRISQTFDQYSMIINFLKREGAFLNNIRPEYLLGWHDLLMYYKKKPSEKSMPAASKLGETSHRYLSCDSWLLLFNQILKLYFVNKITLARFKAVTVLNDSSKRLPPGAESSTIFSVPELILLRWCDLCFEKARDETKHFNPLTGTFGNGLALAALVHLYTSNSWKPMQRMKELIINKQENLENMNVIIETFTDMGLHYVPEFSELGNIEARELILLLAYLFSALPSYQPKDTIIFECKVDDVISKKVTLFNPTPYLLIYTVVLDSNVKDFSVKENSVKVDPKLSSDLVITFKGRISKPVSARLILKPKNDHEQLMAPIVYDLRSKITGRYTTDRLVVKDTMLYDIKAKELKITNPFSKDCDFNIEVHYLPTMSGEPTSFKKRKPLAGNSSPKTRSQPEQTQSRILPSFFIGQDKIQLRKGRQNKLKVTYLPLTFEVHHCYVVLIDEEVGELQYELIGIPLYPSPIQTFNIVTSIENTKPHDVNTSLVYKAKHIAYGNAAKLVTSVRNDQARQALLMFINNQKDEEHFRLESSSPKELVFPATFTILSSKKLESREHDQASYSNVLQVGLNIRYPVKNYTITLIMKNSDLTDVRLYEFPITILPKIFKANIEFTTPVRIPLEQPIPVTNPCEQDIVFTVNRDESLTLNSNQEYFSVPRTLKVKAQSTENLPVVFNPLWKGVATCTIKILNPVTQEEFQYTMKGTGEEPLAENHYIVKCNVGEEKKLPIIVDNPESVAKEYIVNIDAYGLSGANRFKVDANSKGQYMVTVKPILGGVYAGCLTMTDQNKHYIWYTFELEFQGKKNLRTLEVSGIIRKNNPIEIELDNPTDDKVEYKVSIKGEGLSGYETVIVPPRGKFPYTLHFFPLRVFVGEGTVVFTNSRVGEVMCRLALSSSEPTPVKLPMMKCEVGKSMEHPIELENPSSKPVKVTVTPFTSDCFTVSEKEFEIPPFEHKTVRIVYTPNEIDVQNSVDLSFLTENIGSWRYMAFGKGQYPTSYPTKEFVLELQKDASGTITFKNPFKVAINVSVRLELADQADEQVFDLINKKTKMVIGPHGSVQVAISFYPSEIKDYNCTVLIYLNEKISWRFPIKLVIESKTKAVEMVVSTICRKKIEKDFVIQLPGLATLDPQEPYSLELLSIAKGDVDIVRKWFTVLNDKAYIDPATHELRFTIRFNPQKPMKTYGEVLITRRSGGKWRYKIQLEAVEPEPLDTIQITSPLNVTSSVRFVLDSDIKTGEKFTAEFTYDSASEFTVIPKSGTLTSMIKGGTTFTVSFTPVEYGKERLGKLIIQTDTKFYSYSVRGTFPPYEPPKNVKGKVSETFGLQSMLKSLL